MCKIFPKMCPKFRRILNQPLEIAKLLKFRQSGNILSNLVTLLWIILAKPCIKLM